MLQHAVPTVIVPSGSQKASGRAARARRNYLLTLAGTRRVRLEGSAGDLRVGDTIGLWVRNANDPINLYDMFYALRAGMVEAVWERPGRKKGT